MALSQPACYAAIRISVSSGKAHANTNADESTINLAGCSLKQRVGKSAAAEGMKSNFSASDDLRGAVRAMRLKA
jgi:hypothetical protein